MREEQSKPQWGALNVNDSQEEEMIVSTDKVLDMGSTLEEWSNAEAKVKELESQFGVTVNWSETRTNEVNKRTKAVEKKGVGR